MQKIPIGQAQPGMILGKPAARSDGMVIIPEGAELTASHLERLERMGLEHLTIKGAATLECTEGEATLYRQRLDRLPHLFRSHRGDAWMDLVLRHLTDSLTQRLAACSGSLADSPNDQPASESA